jgi:hypothetical protein
MSAASAIAAADPVMRLTVRQGPLAVAVPAAELLVRAVDVADRLNRVRKRTPRRERAHPFDRAHLRAYDFSFRPFSRVRNINCALDPDPARIRGIAHDIEYDRALILKRDRALERTRALDIVHECAERAERDRARYRVLNSSRYLERERAERAERARAARDHPRRRARAPVVYGILDGTLYLACVLALILAIAVAVVITPLTLALDRAFSPSRACRITRHIIGYRYAFNYLTYLDRAIGRAIGRAIDRAIDRLPVVYGILFRACVLALILAIPVAVVIDLLVFALAFPSELALALTRDIALACVRVLNRAFDRARARAGARDIAREHARSLDLDRDLALNRDLDLARMLTRALDQARDLNLARARDLTRALDHVLDRSSARSLDLAIIPDLDTARGLNLARARNLSRQLASVLTAALSESLGIEHHEGLAGGVLDGALDDFSQADISAANLAHIDLTGVRWTVSGTHWPPGMDIKTLLQQSRETESGSEAYVVTRWRKARSDPGDPE